MTASYDSGRSVALVGPGGMKDMLLTRLTAHEQISRPFQFDLELRCEQGSVRTDSILGRPASVQLLATAQQRYFHGIVTEFEYVGYGECYHEYRAVLRPAFWLLTRRTDCRIFQKLRTPDIFTKVCREAGFTDHRLALSSNYSAREYCVQYRESDFDFLSRLLEHEGIYYFFEHSGDRHVLVLTDDVGKLKTVEGYDKVPYYPLASAGTQRKRDHLYSWSVSSSFQAAAVAARDCRYGMPSGIAGAVSPVAERRSEDVSRFEMFEYPAGVDAVSSTTVEHITKLRAQQLQTSQSILRSQGDAAGLAAGHVFTLTGCPDDALNKQYLVTSTRCDVTAEAMQTGGAAGAPAGAPQFAISIEAIDAKQPFRPARLTPKPLIQGAQTAIVVGKQDEEIASDELGSVKVQFHWDRAGKSDENSSCWVRVAQAWAGKQWGSLYVPRIGQEVVVSFLDGDPDRPLIIGSLYNPEQLPAYSPASRPTVSGVKSRSSKEGTAENFNEIRFEDKKGEEEIYLHAEKNLQVVVENNQTITIGADKKDAGDRTVTIHNDDKLTIGRNFEIDIKEKETRTVGKDRVTTLKANDTADVTQKFKLKAGDEITLEVGASKLVMKSDGTIELTGKQLKIAGDMKVDISGNEIGLKGNAKVEIDGTQTAVSGKQLDLKGTKTAVEGSGMLDLASSGIASLKGSLTKIG